MPFRANLGSAAATQLLPTGAGSRTLCPSRTGRDLGGVLIAFTAGYAALGGLAIIDVVAVDAVLGHPPVDRSRDDADVVSGSDTLHVDDLVTTLIAGNTLSPSVSCRR